jgi:microcin C transport system permease protein
MIHYLLRRLAILPLTLLGMTFIIFGITRIMPGGPMEKALEEAVMKQEGSKSSVKVRGANSALSPEQLEKMSEQFGFDLPYMQGYLAWLGLIPKEINRKKEYFKNDITEVSFLIPGSDQQCQVKRVNQNQVQAINLSAELQQKWSFRFYSKEEQQNIWNRLNPKNQASTPFYDGVMMYQSTYQGLIQGNFGYSLKYNKPVLFLLKERFPISIFYGLMSLILTYGICIPLGVVKAIHHRTPLDTTSSIFIFLGYAIPNYALSVLLLIYFAAEKKWFPLGGFTSDHFSQMTFFEQIFDILHHAFLPMLCYCIGSFASLTMMVKNNLLEHLAADYIKTAIAKGLPFSKAVIYHALRNSFIPVASGLGGSISFIIAGSVLVERIFDIDGFGLMSFNALVEQDNTVVMAIITISGFLSLLGNILSDLITAKLDPRIRYD